MGDRRGLLTWLLLGLGVFLTIQLVTGFLGDKEGERQPISRMPTVSDAADGARPAERLCDIWTDHFRAQLSNHGAAIKHFELLTAKYQRHGKPLDLGTTPDHEVMRQLFVHFRNPAAGKAEDPKWNVRVDTPTWTLERADGKSCAFSWSDARVKLTKLVAASDRPYELTLTASIENASDQKLAHAVTIESSAWRYESEVSGGMFTVSPFLTHVECVRDTGKAERLAPADFAPADFAEAPFAKNATNDGMWYQDPGPASYAAVSNAYFSHALVPKPGDSPACQLQVWTLAGQGDKRALSGSFYRARLAYPERELEPGKSATYEVATYIGPKERDILAVAGGVPNGLSELIDLGFFSVIAKVLVAFLLKVYSSSPNWGSASLVLTLTARTLLFPLSLPMIRNSIEMRKLKPEMDALNEKFKDDPQQRGLAQMELWRKNGVSPFKGCLPQVASMPVWFALYTTLQTAVELYNIPFLWFPDLSEADPLYILPFVIGGTTFLQQKLLPQQGDPAQQKMMLYMMPGMFTVFMLFLPSGLGVYMFTNGLIAMAQQQIVEWHVRRTMPPGGGDIQVKIRDDDEPPSGGDKKGSKRRPGTKQQIA